MAHVVTSPEGMRASEFEIAVAKLAEIHGLPRVAVIQMYLSDADTIQIRGATVYDGEHIIAIPDLAQNLLAMMQGALDKAGVPTSEPRTVS